MRFNTSYVVIKQTGTFAWGELNGGFNTSYVVIKHKGDKNMDNTKTSFNTSYVVIKPERTDFNKDGIVEFQYILCCY